VELNCVAFDPDFQPGAWNAVNVCLRLKPEERVTIITDLEAMDIAASLVAEIERVGSTYKAFVLEEFGDRPFSGMPQPVLDDLAKSQVSVFAASAQTGELAARIAMTDVVNRHGIRHGHMVNIDRRVMKEGMRADFAEVDDLSTRLIAKARAAATITVKSAAGTNVLAKFSPSLKWIKTSGIITPEKWGNLPGGEIFTSPATVDGRFVVDGVVGDYLCNKYGDLRKKPLAIEIRDSRIVGLECDDQVLLDEFRAYTLTDENSNRVGEFALGTNTAVHDVIGNILQDEKIPGIHIAFGHPYSQHTGADWISSTHIDCVGRNFDVWLDEEQVMAEGRFLI
jgi:aminopeptidase